MNVPGDIGHAAAQQPNPYASPFNLAYLPQQPQQQHLNMAIQRPPSGLAYGHPQQPQLSQLQQQGQHQQQSMFALQPPPQQSAQQQMQMHGMAPNAITQAIQRQLQARGVNPFAPTAGPPQAQAGAPDPLAMLRAQALANQQGAPQGQPQQVLQQPLKMNPSMDQRAQLGHLMGLAKQGVASPEQIAQLHRFIGDQGMRQFGLGDLLLPTGGVVGKAVGAAPGLMAHNPAAMRSVGGTRPHTPQNQTPQLAPLPLGPQPGQPQPQTQMSSLQPGLGSQMNLQSSGGGPAQATMAPGQRPTGPEMEWLKNSVNQIRQHAVEQQNLAASIQPGTHYTADKARMIQDHQIRSRDVDVIKREVTEFVNRHGGHEAIQRELAAMGQAGGVAPGSVPPAPQAGQQNNAQANAAAMAAQNRARAGAASAGSGPGNVQLASQGASGSQSSPFLGAMQPQQGAQHPGGAGNVAAGQNHQFDQLQKLHAQHAQQQQQVALSQAHAQQQQQFAISAAAGAAFRPGTASPHPPIRPPSQPQGLHGQGPQNGLPGQIQPPHLQLGGQPQAGGNGGPNAGLGVHPVGATHGAPPQSVPAGMAVATSGPNNNATLAQQVQHQVTLIVSRLRREIFINAMKKTQGRRGGQWNGNPPIRGKELDVWILFRSVIQSGGFDHVTSSRLWPSIVAHLGIPFNPQLHMDSDAVSAEISNLYRQYCLEFERDIENSARMQVKAALNAQQQQQPPHPQSQQTMPPSQNPSTPVQNPMQLQAKPGQQNPIAMNQNQNHLAHPMQPGTAVGHMPGNAVTGPTGQGIPQQGGPNPGAQVGNDHLLRMPEEEWVQLASTLNHHMRESIDKARRQYRENQSQQHQQQPLQHQSHSPAPPQSQPQPLQVQGNNQPAMSMGAQQPAVGQAQSGARPNGPGHNTVKLEEAKRNLEIFKNEVVNSPHYRNKMQAKVPPMNQQEVLQYRQDYKEVMILVRHMFALLPMYLALTDQADKTKHAVLMCALVQAGADRLNQGQDPFLSMSDLMHIKVAHETIKTQCAQSMLVNGIPVPEMLRTTSEQIIQLHMQSQQAQQQIQHQFQQGQGQPQQAPPQSIVPHQMQHQQQSQQNANPSLQHFSAQPGQLQHLPMQQHSPPRPGMQASDSSAPPAQFHQSVTHSAPSPAFGEHLKPGIRREDLKPPPAKRTKTGTSAASPLNGNASLGQSGAVGSPSTINLAGTHPSPAVVDLSSNAAFNAGTVSSTAVAETSPSAGSRSPGKSLRGRGARGRKASVAMGRDKNSGHKSAAVEHKSETESIVVVSSTPNNALASSPLPILGNGPVTSSVDAVPTSNAGTNGPTPISSAIMPHSSVPVTTGVHLNHLPAVVAPGQLLLSETDKDAMRKAEDEAALADPKAFLARMFQESDGPVCSTTSPPAFVQHWSNLQKQASNAPNTCLTSQTGTAESRRAAIEATIPKQVREVGNEFRPFSTMLSGPGSSSHKVSENSAPSTGRAVGSMKGENHVGGVDGELTAQSADVDFSFFLNDFDPSAAEDDTWGSANSRTVTSANGSGTTTVPTSASTTAHGVEAETPVLSPSKPSQDNTPASSTTDADQMERAKEAFAPLYPLGSTVTVNPITSLKVMGKDPMLTRGENESKSNVGGGVEVVGVGSSYEDVIGSFEDILATDFDFNQDWDSNPNATSNHSWDEVPVF